MASVEQVRQLAEALRRASAEHGRPNSFGCTELAELHGGPAREVIGRIGRNQRSRMSLYAALGGHAKWGSAPQYSDGRFYV